MSWGTSRDLPRHEPAKKNLIWGVAVFSVFARSSLALRSYFATPRALRGVRDPAHLGIGWGDPGSYFDPLSMDFGAYSLRRYRLPTDHGIICVVRPSKKTFFFSESKREGNAFFARSSLRSQWRLLRATAILFGTFSSHARIWMLTGLFGEHCVRVACFVFAPLLSFDQQRAALRR